ncbi:hypothetical protein [Streptomyces sp. NPDC048612]|uniref:hypothetical protein n=1 Tax=Streptomyces sp. NPDC048612 TaxID=3365579 RepID=UPI00371A7698
MLEPHTPATWHITLPRGVTAVPIARAMVRTAMQDLRATADRTTAQLLTAELVTNVLKHTHGAGPIELVVELRPAGCRIEVHDDNPSLVEGLGDPLPLTEPGTPVTATAPAALPPVFTADGPGPADSHVPAQRAEAPGREGRSGDEPDGGKGDGDAPDGGRGAESAHGPEDRHDEDGGGADRGGSEEANGQEAADRGEGADGHEGPGPAALAGHDPDTADGAHATDDTDAEADLDTPSPAAPGCGEHDGRGLLLIRALSAASGCRPTPRGKAVWFTLPELRRPRRR